MANVNLASTISQLHAAAAAVRAVKSTVPVKRARQDKTSALVTGCAPRWIAETCSFLQVEREATVEFILTFDVAAQSHVELPAHLADATQALSYVIEVNVL